MSKFIDGTDQINSARFAFKAFVQLIESAGEKIEEVDSYGLHELLRPIQENLDRGSKLHDEYWAEVRTIEDAKESKIKEEKEAEERAFRESMEPSYSRCMARLGISDMEKAA